MADDETRAGTGGTPSSAKPATGSESDAPAPTISMTDSSDAAAAAPSQAPQVPGQQPCIRDHWEGTDRTSSSIGCVSFWRRFAAIAIDLCILGLASTLVLSRSGLEETPGWIATVVAVVWYLVVALYFIVPYSGTGRTLGKAMLSIRVISLDGAPLSWRRGILRTAGYLISCLPCYAGFFWSIWDPDKQAWHDKLAGTVVVKSSSAQERTRNAVEPSIAAARQKRWLRLLGIPSAGLAVSLGVAMCAHFRSELQKMEPWPSDSVSPRTAVPLDVSHWGLTVGEVRDAQDRGAWSNGQYEDGVMVTYVVGDRTVATVWVLKYRDEAAAGADFASAENWGPRTAAAMGYDGMNSEENYRMFGSGMHVFKTPVVAQRIYLHERWIVDIWTMQGTTVTPGALAAIVRDAVAAHWRAQVSRHSILPIG
jgi:uncharacterized RDD family membrane protein YckC